MQDDYYNYYGGNTQGAQEDPSAQMENPYAYNPASNLPQSGGATPRNMNQMQMAGLLIASGMPFSKAMLATAGMEQQRQAQAEQAYKVQMMQRQTQLDQDLIGQIGGGVSSMGAPQPMQENTTLADINTNNPPLVSAPQNSQFSRLDPETRQLAINLIRSGDRAGALKLINENKTTTKDTFEFENKLRDEFVNQSKPWHDVNSAYTRIKAAGSDPTAAGDLALIFNYMKMLDPGSTVREGEFANAQNAGGLPERLRAQYNKAVNGEFLSANQRKDFLDRASKLYKGQQVDQRRLEKRYEGLAKNNKLNPENVIIKYEDSDGAEMQSITESQALPRRSIQDLSDEELLSIAGGG